MKKSSEVTNPSSCFNKAWPDEPIFVLRSSDTLAPGIVRAWAAEAARHGTPSAKVAEARAMADAMVVWANAHGGGKVPD